MKITHFSFVCLLLALVTQTVVSKPSTPIEGCRLTKTVPSDGTITTCFEFAEKYNTTFEKLMKLNPGLHKNCDNLDTGNQICILGPKTTPNPAHAAPDNTLAQTPSIPETAYVPKSSVIQPKVDSNPKPKIDTTPKSKVESKPQSKVASTPQPKVKSKSSEAISQPQTIRTLYPNLAKAAAAAARPESVGSSASNQASKIAPLPAF
ncbi:hypothetical protein BGZ76_002043 [Entomortierella beljakovae]|nr:hypothetical protein BGZ76_002043 [Entomortierella beljakovae]